jgi:hypothetical protein
MVNSISDQSDDVWERTTAFGSIDEVRVSV